MERGIQLRDRFEGESALVEARVRHDQVVLGVGDASAVEGQDVEIDDAWTPAPAVRIAAKPQLDALQLEEEGAAA